VYVVLFVGLLWANLLIVTIKHHLFRGGVVLTWVDDILLPRITEWMIRIVLDRELCAVRYCYQRRLGI